MQYSLNLVSILVLLDNQGRKSIATQSYRIILRIHPRIANELTTRDLGIILRIILKWSVWE